MDNELINAIKTEQVSSLYQWVFDYMDNLGLSQQVSHIFTSGILLLAISIVLFTADYIFRRVLKRIFIKIVRSTKTRWDDLLLRNKVIDNFSHFILVFTAQQLVPLLFVSFNSFKLVLGKVLTILVILTLFKLINSFLKTLRDILRTTKAFVDKPLDSYLQVVQIVLIFIAFTIIFSIITEKSPWSLLLSLGAASAILMLVFKDTILGFVASIQVSANDTVRVGDWIEMQKYGADGSVIEINLNNVKVQNFDKTIVTIPTHTLLSDSFKNYRGMQRSGGRRIKRAIHIKISSIRYLSESEISELKKIQLLAPFIDTREQEINAYNERTGADRTVLVNGRHMTNVGLFRAYVQAYIRNNPNVHQNMTLMVRQLAPTEHGLPMELYLFTKGTDWVFFETVMADIFDHLFAAIKYFHLEIFELPASDDLRQVMAQITENK